MPKWSFHVAGICYSLYGVMCIVRSWCEADSALASEFWFRGMAIGAIMWLSIQLDRSEARHA